MTWESWLWGNSDWGTFHTAGDEVDAPSRAVKNEPDHNQGELWWLERAYEHIAIVSPCQKCGTQLNRRVRAVRASRTFAGGVVGYVMGTRCGGWRRHRLVAMVSIDSGDLVLGRFLTRGSAPLPIRDASSTLRKEDT